MKQLIISLLVILVIGQNLQSQNKELYKSDLPLVPIASSVKSDLPFVFFISGDGGWTSLDQSICDKLAENGMPVLGLNAQKYFWNEKQPKTVALDFSIEIRHYMKMWNKNSFILLGYSFGACVAPFVANNFDDQLKVIMKSVYCFSPDLTGDFEIHLSDMMHFNTKGKYDVINELTKIKSLNPVCVFGDEEELKTRNEFSKLGIKIKMLPGTHHYNNDFEAIANIILKDF